MTSKYPPGFHPGRVCRVPSAHSRFEREARAQGHCSRMTGAVAAELEIERQSKLAEADLRLERLFHHAKSRDYVYLYYWELDHGVRKPDPPQRMFQMGEVTPTPMAQPTSLIFYQDYRTLMPGRKPGDTVDATTLGGPTDLEKRRQVRDLLDG